MNSNYFESGDDAYSYQTCIRTSIPSKNPEDGPLVIYNNTKYSATTSKHQKQSYLPNRCYVVLSPDVPKGSTAADLRDRARGQLGVIAL